MDYTQEEYDEIFKFVESSMKYNEHLYSNMNKDDKQQFIKEKVDKHFIEFLNINGEGLRWSDRLNVNACI